MFLESNFGLLRELGPDLPGLKSPKVCAVVVDKIHNAKMADNNFVFIFYIFRIIVRSKISF